MIEINLKWNILINKIQIHCEKKNLDECTICCEDKADTAIIPCGHKYFCYKCIDIYWKTHPNKGCPICRSDILTISKIFSS